MDFLDIDNEFKQPLLWSCMLGSIMIIYSGFMIFKLLAIIFMLIIIYYMNEGYFDCDNCDYIICRCHINRPASTPSYYSNVDVINAFYFE